MNIVLIVGLKIFFDLSDVVYTQVVYITYNKGNRDLPDIYAHALGPAYLLDICLSQYLWLYF